VWEEDNQEKEKGDPGLSPLFEGLRREYRRLRKKFGKGDLLKDDF
jgi:hypothetical protein